MWLILRAALLALCARAALSARRVCELEDSACITASVQRKAARGEVAVEPLHVEEVVARLLDFNYTMWNVTVWGLRDCTPDLLQLRGREALSCEYQLACPHIKWEGEYQAQGALGPRTVDNSGYISIEFEEYVFALRGECEVRPGEGGLRPGEGGLRHLHVNSFTTEVVTRGRARYNATLHNADSARNAEINKFLNDNWKEIDQSTRQPGVDALMHCFIDLQNNYYERTPIEDIFYAEE